MLHDYILQPLIQPPPSNMLHILKAHCKISPSTCLPQPIYGDLFSGAYLPMSKRRLLCTLTQGWALPVFLSSHTMDTVVQGAGSLFLEGGPAPTTSTTWGPSGETPVLRSWASPLCPHNSCPQPGNCTPWACFSIPLNFQGFLKHSFNIALFFHFRSVGAAAVY